MSNGKVIVKIGNTINVNVQEQKISVGVASLVQEKFTTDIELDGSDFSGITGATGRSYTYTAGLRTNVMVFVEGVKVKQSNLAFSTTTRANDTITINVPIYNDDEVTIRL